jgi:hypothetical protein
MWCSTVEKSFSSDGNDRSCFDERRLGLVGDQLAQKWDQHDERNTDREAAGAELCEQLRVSGIGGNRPQRPGNEPEISACARGEFEACLEQERV